MATSVVGLGLLWNERSGRQGTKDDFETRIEEAKIELGQKIDATKVELIAQAQHTRSIALGSAYVTMKSLSGDRQMMKKWMAEIEPCIASDGVNCDPVEGIAAIAKHTIQSK